MAVALDRVAQVDHRKTDTVGILGIGIGAAALIVAGAFALFLLTVVPHLE